MIPAENHRTRNLIIAIVVIAVALIGWQLGLWISRLGLVALTVEAVPHDSVVTLDNKNIKSNGVTYIKPGTHTITASRQYFNDDVQQIDTTSLHGDTVYLLPSPKQPDGFNWLKDHPDVQQRREVVGGIIEQRNQQALIKKYPVVQQLPAQTDTYQIDYMIGKDQSVSFQVTLLGDSLSDSKEAALNFLKANKVDINTAHIIYSNIDKLASMGLTSDQVDSFNRGLADLAKKQSATFTTSLIDPNSVRTAPLNGSNNFGIDFLLDLNGHNYKTSVRYSDLQSIKLTLRDTETNKVVYDQRIETQY
ncbi:MAG TPA: hypothetical protein VFL85_03135 [Candidatus Saccharimonadales bacterium]|nr:hypothetical protein [Candidatus Saccharimonadales bacterium]